MNQKKNTKILMILITIVVIFLLVLGIVFVFLATDLFKSDKELFFKYMTQMGDVKEGFIENNLIQYFEKQKTTPYNDEGTFSVNIASEKNQEQLENINNFNITFSGQVDTANSKSNQEISLNYSDDVKFPIKYKQIENKIGLQTDYVGKNFIALETDKLDNLFENTMSINMDSLQKLQELDKIELTEEEKNHIQSTYGEIFNQQLSKEKFSKVKESDKNGYKLSLTGEELKNIILQLLETLKDDQTTLDKLNGYLQIQKSSNKISIRDIDNVIKSINNNSEELDKQNFEITVYNKRRKTSKIVISTNELKLDIQKEKNQDNVQYNVGLEVTQENETVKIHAKADYTGLSSIQNVKETYELVLELQEQQWQYQLNNNINFTDSVSIEEFTNQNSILLTNYEHDQVSNFLNAVRERIGQVNKQQMEQLGVEENKNPILYMMSMPTEISHSNNLIGNVLNEELQEEAVNSFNQKFEIYANTNQPGVTVKGLFSVISSNNAQEDNNMKIKEINFNGEEYEATDENIAFIKGDIDTSKNYRVEFEKDQNTGLIYRVVINQK